MKSKPFVMISISCIVLFSMMGLFFTIEAKTVPTKKIILSGTDIAEQSLPKTPTKKTLPSASTIFLDGTEHISTSQLSSQNKQTYYSNETINFDIEQAKETIEKLQDGIRDISNKIKKLDQETNPEDTKYQNMRQEIMNVISNMITTKNLLEQKIDDIVDYKRVILKSAQQITTIDHDIQELTQYVQEFSLMLYKIQNTFYTQNGDFDTLKVFLSSESSLSDTLANTYMIEKLTKELTKLLETLEVHKQRQRKRIKVSNTYKIQLREDIAYYNEKLTNLEEKRQYLAEYLDMYEQHRDEIEGTMKSLFDTRKDIQKTIMESVEQIQQETYIANFDMKEKMEALHNLKPFAKYERSSKYSRPILPVTNISSSFKDPDYKKKYDLVQYGIEIPTPQGTPVYATDDAIVYKVQNNNDIGVNRAILIHKDKSVSVYKYLNEFTKSAGDIVRRGELLGHSGGEPGTPGAGFISKQPNLTLMIFENGTFVDPLSVLDLSIFVNKSVVDKKYHIKYLEDLYRRPRDMYKITFMSGMTLNQRRVQFLERYGVGIYRELAFWQDAAMDTNIDMDVGVCIGFAESTLGQHLTTSNNIGNVGNNDRGDRISFGSALQGAKLIYNTLNNQYLHQYNTIIELNGHGNKDGKVYASSPYNWQNNVIKCLSMIKGYYVPDDYPFRVGEVPTKE